MAHSNSNNSANNAPAKASQNQAATISSADRKKHTPMIVERVNKMRMVNFAVTMGFSQYNKLKSSNATVGDVITRAESFAAYLWQRVQPIVEKLQPIVDKFEEPISKADRLACNTLDFVEDKLKILHATH